MSTNNNFLKISVFNLEQQIKSISEKYLQDTEVFTQEITKLIGKIRAKDDYPNKGSTLANLELYNASLDIIKFETNHLIECIEILYTGGIDNKSKPKPKPTKVKKTTKKPKKPKQP